MSDQQYEIFQQYGTNAERLAFTPNPAAGIQPIYIWYETDTGSSYVYDSSWHTLAGAGGGLPASVQGDLFYASGVNTVVALAKNASATRYLSNTGGSNNPAWAQVNVANGVTGILPVANGGTGSASGAAILKAEVTLTDAQVKALPTTAFTLVAAPGLGFTIVPLMVYLNSKFVAGAYTNINANSSMQVDLPVGSTWSNYLANDSGASLTYLSTFLGASSGRVVFREYQDVSTTSPGWGPLVYPPGSTFENGALQLKVDNGGSGDFTGGNAANGLKVVTYYTVESVL